MPPPITLPSVVMSGDRKSTRLNSSHVSISYAVFCLKKKKRKSAHHSSTLPSLLSRLRRHRPHLALHSFPTRRSSDLRGDGDRISGQRSRLVHRTERRDELHQVRAAAVGADRHAAADHLAQRRDVGRSEEHTSELQSRFDLVCRLLLEKKKKKKCSSLVDPPFPALSPAPAPPPPSSTLFPYTTLFRSPRRRRSDFRTAFPPGTSDRAARRASSGPRGRRRRRSACRRRSPCPAS